MAMKYSSQGIRLLSQDFNGKKSSSLSFKFAHGCADTHAQCPKLATEYYNYFTIFQEQHHQNHNK